MGWLKQWMDMHMIMREFLDSIPPDLYQKQPFAPRFKSFAWEFSCILTTREMYLEGLKCRKLDADTKCRSSEEALAFSKEEICPELERTYKEILCLLADKKVSGILFWGDKTSKVEVLSWLLQHEQLHFGKLMLYCAQAGIPLPASLKKMWGEESFK